MTEITFYKYHGTGNDFVMIDNRENKINLTTEHIKNICTRRFGVGADGLILLENQAGVDFKMDYYNSDGNRSTMCGNGGRCLVKFAHDLGIVQDRTTFRAIDGLHDAHLEKDWVYLKMVDTKMAVAKANGWFVDTGSPHHVKHVSNNQNTDVFNEGKSIRNEVYGTEGANVNFVQKINNNTLSVRTYERGVENETFSCGTGVTACALVAFQEGWVDQNSVNINTLGGDLKVSFNLVNDGFTQVYLAGPAVQVFKGILKI